MIKITKKNVTEDDNENEEEEDGENEEEEDGENEEEEEDFVEIRVMQDIASNIDEAIRRTTPYCFYNYYNFRSKAIMIIMENPVQPHLRKIKNFY